MDWTKHTAAAVAPMLAAALPRQSELHSPFPYSRSGKIRESRRASRTGSTSSRLFYSNEPNFLRQTRRLCQFWSGNRRSLAAFSRGKCASHARDGYFWDALAPKLASMTASITRARALSILLHRALPWPLGRRGCRTFSQYPVLATQALPMMEDNR